MKKHKLLFIVGLSILGGISKGNSQNYTAPAATTGGNNNTLVGPSAGAVNTSNSNSAFGSNTMATTTTGGFNSAFGAWSLRLNVDGELNSTLGTRSMELNVSGAGNVAMGHRALESNTTGNGNVAIGYGALCLRPGAPTTNIGSFNIALGNDSPRNFFSGNYNVFVGNETAVNLNSGSFNTIIGHVAFEDAASTPDQAGNNTDRTIILADGAGSQRLFIHSNGYAGFGLGNNNIPKNRLELNGGLANTSGLRFRSYTSAINPTTSATKFLTVNGSGDVILQNLPTGNGVTTNTLTNPSNTMTSTVNGVAASAPVVNSISNTIVNGQLVTSVNGIAAPPITLPSVSATAHNIYNSDDAFNSSGGMEFNPNGELRTVTMGKYNLFFKTLDNTHYPKYGKVYIGKEASFPYSTGGYRLYVEGGILTEKVKVAMRYTTDWADYVFGKDYKLMPLKDVETFVTTHHHLPNVASSQELVDGGLDIGVMQAKQMEKIEELTLYAIEQEKKIEKQNKDIEELKMQVQALLNRK